MFFDFVYVIYIYVCVCVALLFVFKTSRLALFLHIFWKVQYHLVFALVEISNHSLTLHALQPLRLLMRLWSSEVELNRRLSRCQSLQVGFFGESP